MVRRHSLHGANPRPVESPPKRKRTAGRSCFLWFGREEGWTVVNRVELEIGGGGAAAVGLGSRDGMNSLGIAEIARLIEIVDRVAGDDAIRALVLSGEENFSAGTDFQQSMLHRLDPEAGGLAYRFLTDQKTVCDRIRGLRIPTLSLVRGLCAGSALGIAAAADFLITDTTTRIRLPEVKVGLIPGNGASWFLPRRMGPAAAKYYGLTAAPMSGKQAVGLGLAQGYAGDDASGFIAELRKAKGPLDRQRILALLQKGGTRESFQEEVRELSEKIGRHFGFGKANRGYLGDIFAQEGLYDEDEALAVELKFAQEMTAGFAHMEGVLGLAKGFLSGESESHLDRIVLSDARGFRTSIPATPVSTGCRLAEDAPFQYEANEYVLPRGEYHCGEKTRALAPRGAAAP